MLLHSLPLSYLFCTIPFPSLPFSCIVLYFRLRYVHTYVSVHSSIRAVPRFTSIHPTHPIPCNLRASREYCTLRERSTAQHSKAEYSALLRVLYRLRRGQRLRGGWNGGKYDTPPTLCIALLLYFSLPDTIEHYNYSTLLRPTMFYSSTVGVTVTITGSIVSFYISQVKLSELSRNVIPSPFAAVSYRHCFLFCFSPILLT